MPTTTNNTNTNANTNNNANIPYVSRNYGIDNENPISLKKDIIKHITEKLGMEISEFKFTEIGTDTLSIFSDGLVIFIVTDKDWTANVKNIQYGTQLRNKIGLFALPVVIGLTDFNNNMARVLSLFNVTAGITSFSIRELTSRIGGDMVAEDYYAVITANTKSNSNGPQEFMAISTNEHGGGKLATVSKGVVGLCWNEPSFTADGILPKVSPALKPCYYITDIVSTSPQGDVSVDTLKLVKAMIAMIGALGQDKRYGGWLSDHVGVGVSFKINGINGAIPTLITTASLDGNRTAFDDVFFLALEEMGINVKEAVKLQLEERVKTARPIQPIERRSYDTDTVLNIKYYDDYTTNYKSHDFIRPKRGADNVVTREAGKHIQFVKHIIQLAELGVDVDVERSVGVQNPKEGVLLSATISPLILSAINTQLQQKRGGSIDILGQTEVIDGIDPTRVLAKAGSTTGIGYGKTINIFQQPQQQPQQTTTIKSGGNNGIGI